jgi:lipoprotein NlpD
MTPIRNYLPGYLDVEVRKEILQNALRADSLEKKIAVQSKYLNNIEAILSGNISIDSIQKADSIPNTADNYDIPRGKNDSVFVKQFEEEEKYKINTLNPESSELSFRKPIKGVISDSFSDEKKHGGIDLTASAGEKVLATLPGTVVYAGYDNNFGNVITLQHENDFISIYKHNDRLLKKIGDKVTGGEAIAIIGNTGNFSTGAHLHFEIWHRGMQVDPTKFIRF